MFVEKVWSVHPSRTPSLVLCLLSILPQHPGQPPSTGLSLHQVGAPPGRASGGHEQGHALCMCVVISRALSSFYAHVFFYVRHACEKGHLIYRCE